MDLALAKCAIGYNSCALQLNFHPTTIGVRSAFGGLNNLQLLDIVGFVPKNTASRPCNSKSLPSPKALMPTMPSFPVKEVDMPAQVKPTYKNRASAQKTQRSKNPHHKYTPAPMWITAKVARLKLGCLVFWLCTADRQFLRSLILLNG